MRKETREVFRLCLMLCLLGMMIGTASGRIVAGAAGFICDTNFGDEFRMQVAAAPKTIVTAGDTSQISVSVQVMIPPNGQYPCSPGSKTSCTNTGNTPVFVPAERVKLVLSADPEMNLQKTELYTDASGIAKTILTTSKYTSATEHIITANATSWDLPHDDFLIFGIKDNKESIPGNFHGMICNEPRASTTILVQPQGGGTFKGQVDFELLMGANPSRIYPDQTTPVVVQVFYHGAPDTGRRVDLITDGGIIEPASGLTNASGMFAANFSSPQPGLFTIQAKSERMMEKLNDSRMIDVEVLPPPPVFEGILPSIFGFVTAIPESIVSIVRQKPPHVEINSGDGIADTVKIRSTGIPEAEMQVVVLQETTLSPGTILHDYSVIPQIAVYSPANPSADSQVSMITGPGDTPAVTPTPTFMVKPVPSDQVSGQEILINRPCLPGYALCNGNCVDPLTDPANCGACGLNCGQGFTCASGTCIVSIPKNQLGDVIPAGCTAGEVSCSGVCKNLSVDSDNCGSCGHTCLTGVTCTNSQCVAQVAATLQGGIGRPHL